jgi:hypothetical protein
VVIARMTMRDMARRKAFFTFILTSFSSRYCHLLSHGLIILSNLFVMFVFALSSEIRHREILREGRIGAGRAAAEAG